MELRSGFIIPLFIPGIIARLGFVRNSVFHNAMAGAGCTVEQTQAQVYVTPPVGLSSAACSAASDKASCENLNSPSNQHCLWTGTNCVAAWDLKGEDCIFTNAIFGYNTIDGANSVSVGMRAIGFSQVDASHNEWQSATTSDNVRAEAGSYIEAEVTCATTTCGG